MKCTWPKQKNCIGDQTQPIFHWLGVLHWGNTNFMFCVGGNANFSISRYQHVGIPNAITNRRPQREKFASQWNIGFILERHMFSLLI